MGRDWVWSGFPVLNIEYFTDEQPLPGDSGDGPELASIFGANPE
jgi:hypothetical protein